MNLAKKLRLFAGDVFAARCTIDRVYFNIQIRTAALLAAATRFPSRLRAMDVISSGAPRKIPTTFPVSPFQTRADRSSLPEKIHLPSGENATDVTLPSWPVRVMT
ncbi:MAG: hypothetical protein N2C14_14465, partial [Planctomycetales bacterium]